MGVRRIQLPDEIRALDSLPEPDYASAFELSIQPITTGPPQDWARAVFEGAPPIMRRFIRAGWRFPLRFRLAPPGAPGHILGCRILSDERTMIVLEQRSPLMTAHNIVSVEPTRLVWATLVRYRQPVARPLWSVSATIHHRTLPYLLTRAARAVGPTCGRGSNR
jgi:hypothetical protein